MKRLLLLLSFISCYLLAVAQADINNESFKYHFKPTLTGAAIVYMGKSHSFTLDIIGKKVKESKVAGKAENQNFVDFDKSFIQTSWVPLPQPLPKSYHLSNLSVDQQKDALNGYVDYELDYFVNEQHSKVAHVKREWVTINSKLFIVWYFDFDGGEPTSSSAETATGQIYIATVCFNQVLALNTAIFGKSKFEKPKAMLTQIASTLKLYNKRL